MSIWKKIALGVLIVILVLLAAGWWLTRGVPAQYSVADVTGDDPKLAKPDAQTIPTVKIAKPIGWPDDMTPAAAEGLEVNRFATGLVHPRTMYTLPNGDVIVAETNSPPRDLPGGPEGWIMSLLFREAGADVPSPNKLILLRDEDGDGKAEKSFTLRDGLASPSGLAYANGKLYVANHNAVLSFDYTPGETKLSGNPKKLMDLPGGGNHWMRNLSLSPNGKLLYVAVGSASNIGENGMDAEKGRAVIDEIDLENGSHREYAAGLRNPNGLDWNPWSGELWVTVNERDMLGSDLVPDYLTNVPVGAQYGWPWVYWGNIIDERVTAPMPNFLVSYTRRPEFALGPHVAALGLAFTKEGSRMPEKFSHGAFIAQHGSWNRKPASGYDVVYVQFDERGNPVGKPVPVLKSFLTADGETHGRPTWVAWDKTGALLVSDDTAGIIWRVSAPGAEPAPAPKRIKSQSLPPQRELHGDPADAFNHPPADLMPGNF
ncbi:sorbosone dehydrogenase family protein [Altererythrobacter indicus]|uniref:Sorbosone dehydrogenase family protein n=1 Tax=Altericroceibacterium indicum TaxID=374177 RepID=A0A845A7Y9_9SPHN|nr:sorbosone dehydrogenase family protein [Altericroceibacterium indicum]MXP26482.1 sorbosone dehydrogenase family protein [Altericroceibacterium indicum]